MRTSFGSPAALTYEGDIVSQNYRAKSGVAKENIAFGSVVGFTGTENLGVQNPSPNKFTFSGALIAANVINLSVTVKTIDSNNKEVSTTTAMAPVTYAVSNDATMADIVTAIELLDTKLNATLVGTDSINVIHSDQGVVIISGVLVTLGASQVTATYDFLGTLLGTAIKCPVEVRDDGTVGYNPTMMVGVMTQGLMTVKFVDATTLASTLYAQHVANGATKPRGSIRTGTDSGKATAFTGLTPAKGAGALALGNIELNLP